MAAERPEDILGVIAQKQGTGKTVEELVVRLGGVVTQDLHIINAFAAQLPAKALLELAQARGVRWVSLDAPMAETHEGDGEGRAVADFFPRNVYATVIGADQLWREGLEGRGISVAVVHSGVTDCDDFGDEAGNLRILDWALYGESTARHPDDYYGHGCHVAGFIAGNGSLSGGFYTGVAPQVNLVTVKISDDRGVTYMSDVVAGLQWVLDHGYQYNIRVVNLSLNSTVAESYHTSPLDAALEILWSDRIVVVVSAGNNGHGAAKGILHPPANDPFVITVGATKETGAADTGDDSPAPYSAYGVTVDGFTKPDLLAPGYDVVSLVGKPGCVLAREHADRPQGARSQSSHYYFCMSGTSTASAVTAGAVAPLLQDEPHLAPDQVKYRLTPTARPFTDSAAGSTGAGYLDIHAAVHGRTSGSANSGIAASQLLWVGPDPDVRNGVNRNLVEWSSVRFSSVNWD